MAARYARQFLSEFGIGEPVYLRASEERDPGFVTAISFRGTGASYEITWGNAERTWHFDFELTREYVPNWGSVPTNEEPTS